MGTTLSQRAVETFAHLKEAGVPAEPFIGWNGSVSGIVTTHTYELDNPGSGYIIGRNSMNTCIGHAGMWRAAMLLSGDAFLFMEDDVRFAPDWRSIMEASDVNLPEDWDLAFLGSCCTHGRPKTHLSGRLFKIDFAMCLHAYVIRKKALSRMIEWCERVDSPIDVSVAVQCVPKLVTVAYLPRIADQPETQMPE